MSEVNESKATPGPWAVGNPPFGKIVYGRDPGEGPDAQILVADCWPAILAERGEWRKETATANARLIAAAPDLLAALKATLALWDKHGLGDDDAESEPVYNAVRAAIRRAEGGAP